MSGRGQSSWWPCDSTEHTRERNIDLGIRFGSGGPLVMRVLKDLAQQQRDEHDAGTVMAGFSVLAHLCFLKGGADEARLIVERAGENGSLDDLEVATDGQRFTCRVSGWTSDSVRGRAALKKAAQRAAKKEDEGKGHVAPQGDTSPSADRSRDVSDIAVAVEEPEQDQSDSASVLPLHLSASSSSVAGARVA